MSTRPSTMTMSRGPTRLHSLLESWGPALHAALRIGVALLFMQHGAQKLLGWFGGMDGQGGTAALNSQMGVAGVLELFGGFLVLIGFLTRPIALILVFEMVVAYATAHLPQGGTPSEGTARPGQRERKRDTAA